MAERAWTVSESKVPGYERVISIVAPGQLGICRMDGGGSSNPKVLAEVRAKAELICEAVNAWEDPVTLQDRLDELRGLIAEGNES